MEKNSRRYPAENNSGRSMSRKVRGREGIRKEGTALLTKCPDDLLGTKRKKGVAGSP